jgi:hypothetical protein
MSPNAPLRGPKYRSRAFQEYLLRQTPERAAEIIAAERGYNELHDDPGSVAQAAELQYHGDLTIKVPAEGGQHLEDLLDLMGEA